MIGPYITVVRRHEGLYIGFRHIVVMTGDDHSRLIGRVREPFCVTSYQLCTRAGLVSLPLETTDHTKIASSSNEVTVHTSGPAIANIVMVWGTIYCNHAVRFLRLTIHQTDDQAQTKACRSIFRV